MHTMSYSIPSPSDNSLVRVDGDTIAAKVKARIADLLPLIAETNKEIEALVKEHETKAEEANAVENDYIKERAKIDLDKALRASIIRNPLRGFFNALFCKVDEKIDLFRLGDELISLNADLPSNLKEFWTYERITSVTRRIASERYKEKSLDEEIDLICTMYLNNYRYLTTPRRYKNILFGNRLFEKEKLKNFDYEAFNKVDIENEEYMEEARKLERYKNLTGDVFLTINEFNSLGDYV